ncbi:MAG: glycosyltransferase [Candidatus Nanohaloarchaea archaeon]
MQVPDNNKDIAVFKPLESSSLSLFSEKLYKDIADTYEIQNSRLPILNVTDRLYRTIPEKLSRIEDEYEWAVFASYLPLAGINPEEYDIKIAVFVHGFINKIIVGRTYLGRKTYLRSIKNLGRVDKVLTVSETTKTDLIRHPNNIVSFNDKEIDVIWQGIDKERIYRDNSEPSFDTPEKYILYAGCFPTRKNPKFLLDVLEKLEDDTELVACGANLNPENVNRFLSEVEERKLEDRVNYMGKVSLENLRRLYSNAALYLHPARFEGYGRPPVEAATCGTIPVMYEEVPSYRDLSDVAVPFSDFDSRKVADLVNSNLGKEVNYTPRSWSESRKKLLEALEL